MKIKLLGLGVILTSAGLIFAGQHGAKSGSATTSRHGHGHGHAKQAAHQSNGTGRSGGNPAGFNDGSSPLLSPSPSPSPEASVSPPPQ